MPNYPYLYRNINQVYKDTKSNIEGLSGVNPGSIAFATDTNEWGFYNNSKWIWTANSPQADKIPIANSSGNLDDWITDGKAYTSLQNDNKIGLAGNQLVTANGIRINYDTSTITEDFETTTPSGWSWAGSPFETPASISVINGTWLKLTGMSNWQRSFLYKTDIPSGTWLAVFPVLAVTNFGAYFGIRLDDGTDDTYSEVVLWYSNTGYPIRVYYRSRVGGGAVIESEVTNLAQLMFDGWLVHQVTGTRWSNWNSGARLMSRSGFRAFSSTFGQTMSFTPTRVGLVMKFGNQSWQNYGVDAVNF